MDKIRPGWSGNKTFTVKNNGSLPSTYDIVFEAHVQAIKEHVMD